LKLNTIFHQNLIKYLPFYLLIRTLGLVETIFAKYVYAELNHRI